MDLRGYNDQLKSIGELREIEEADWNLEIGAITELVGEKDGPALLFDKIKGYWKAEFPKVNRVSEELREQTLNKWKDLFSSL